MRFAPSRGSRTAVTLTNWKLALGASIEKNARDFHPDAETSQHFARKPSASVSSIAPGF
jgi:hypothetical protein